MIIKIVFTQISCNYLKIIKFNFFELLWIYICENFLSLFIFYYYCQIILRFIHLKFKLNIHFFTCTNHSNRNNSLSFTIQWNHLKKYLTKLFALLLHYCIFYTQIYALQIGRFLREIINNYLKVVLLIST